MPRAAAVVTRCSLRLRVDRDRTVFVDMHAQHDRVAAHGAILDVLLFFTRVHVDRDDDALAAIRTIETRFFLGLHVDSMLHVDRAVDREVAFAPRAQWVGSIRTRLLTVLGRTRRY